MVKPFGAFHAFLTVFGQALVLGFVVELPLGRSHSTSQLWRSLARSLLRWWRFLPIFLFLRFKLCEKSNKDLKSPECISYFYCNPSLVAHRQQCPCGTARARAALAWQRCVRLPTEWSRIKTNNPGVLLESEANGARWWLLDVLGSEKKLNSVRWSFLMFISDVMRRLVGR